MTMETWRDTMSTFCENIRDDIDGKIAQCTDDSESIVLLHAYREKNSSILTEISAKGDKTWKDHGAKLVKEISQLVLDVTYVKEVQLVDDDFQAESAELDMKYIIDSLTSLETLSKTLCPEEDIVSCLGSEIVECLRWRKGALLYMFCHTVYHRNPIDGLPGHLLHYLEDGVDYLVSMLKTRCDAEWIDSREDKVIKDDGDTLQLIQQGIFSDTHLLALMYCGEMCYWHTKSRDTSINQGRNESKGEESKSKSDSNSKNKNKNLNSGEIHNSKCDKVPEILERTKVSHDTNVDDNKKHSSSVKSKVDVKSNNEVSVTKSSDIIQKEGCDMSKMVRIGNACLKRYVSVAHGPLASAGWSTDRAEDIIFQFQKLNLS